MTDMQTPAEATEQPMLRIPKSANPTPTPTRHPNRRVPVLAYVGALIAIVALLVVGTQALGWFGTKGQTYAGTDERVVPAAGADSTAIKGWMSLQQVLDAYPVTQEALYAQFEIPADTPTSTTLSELKEGGTSTLDVPTLRSWIDDGAPSSP